MNQALDKIARMLGYHESVGYISADNLDQAPTYRHALLHAVEAIKIDGCFGLWSGHNFNRFLPLTYVVCIEDEDVLRIHRLVWNQGLVPFLFVITPSRLVVCDGFTFSSLASRSGRKGELKTIALQNIDENVAFLQRFSARSLQSSVAWRDNSVDIGGRVDHQLLINLKALANTLTEAESSLLQEYQSMPLPLDVAHSLMGRFLYLFFLLDRGILTDEWLHQRQLRVPINDSAKWVVSDFWSLFSALDEIFNGSIFPIEKESVEKVTAGHLNLIHTVMRRADLQKTSMQFRLSFAEFDFASLRIETLAAVYEQFLHSHEESGGASLGAHYTPPFLADYVVDQLEDQCALNEHTKLLDCASGSGVLLVAAYRRLIESQLGKHERTLSLTALRNTLKECIFGIELMADACHVTCFSLYLTLLDYAQPHELVMLEARQQQDRIFPSLMGNNIIEANFFEYGKTPAHFPEKFSCVLSNPPWKSIQDDTAAESYHLAPKRAGLMPVGERQLAELFIWKVVKEHLDKNGVAAFIIPSKSLLNPTGVEFRKKLSSETTWLSVTDFSNLRHVLFTEAHHPPLVLVFQNSAPAFNEASVWHYSPLRATQIGTSGKDGKRSRMWAFLVDESQVQHIPYQDVCGNPNVWVDALFMRPVDRQVMQHIDALLTRKDAFTIRDFQEKGLIDFGRGRDEADTGVPSNFILSSHKAHRNYYENHLDIASTRQLLSSSPIVPLPQGILDNTKEGYKLKFSGNIVLIPRNLKRALFVQAPIAFNSSFISVYSEKKDKAHINLLKAISKVANSSLGRYFLILNAPRFLVDRPNIEVENFGNLPLPFTSISDEKIHQLAELTDCEVDDFIYNTMRISGDYVEAIREFLEFRIGFKDGQIPTKAIEVANENTLSQYRLRLERLLNAKVGRYGRYHIATSQFKDNGIVLVRAQYFSRHSSEEPSQEMSKNLLEKYKFSRLNPISTSSAICRDAQAGAVYLMKPIQHMYWTIENTLWDINRIVTAISSESSQNAEWQPYI